MNYVVKERHEGRWINTYLHTKAEAKILTDKIIKRGGRAVWMRNAL